MVKSYLLERGADYPERKYEHSGTFGTVASSSSNIVWAPDGHVHSSARAPGAGRAIVGAGEDVLSWDLKKSELLARWHDKSCDAEVTSITASAADLDLYAVGYADGSIRLWDSRLSTIVITFNGHRSAVTTLAFDLTGTRLASGSQDTDIIVWDLIAEVGLFKLRGHKNQVTGLCFLPTTTTPPPGPNENLQDGATALGDEPLNGNEHGSQYLLTSGKDALLKLWDLEAQHCMETHVAQSSGECWSLATSPKHDLCLTGGNDGELRAWSIDSTGLSGRAGRVEDDAERIYLREIGTMHRTAKDRTAGIEFHPRSPYIASHGLGKAVEVWRIRPEEEVQKALARKKKRRREKAKTAHGNAKGDEEMEDADAASTDISETIVLYVVVRTTGKVKSMDWSRDATSKTLQLPVSTTNNQIEMYNIPAKEKAKHSKKDEPPDYERSLAIEIPGHRADMRTIALSSDDRMLASASNGSLKVWNVRTHSCIRSLDCGYALCSSFLPGDRIVIIGNRSGELEIFDITASTLVEAVKAHDGAVWTLDVHPDGKSVVSAGADKVVKFWDFKIVQEEVPGTKRTTPKLKLVETRNLKLSDDILSVKFSPDSRLLAVSLLDNTVKVFFVDTLKLFLNLYGHKLPVLNMDISHDSKLIVTCSADKNVRIWGLDFGDCHRALFAHQDSIMQVKFVPSNQDGNGHHFFSASKDRAIKYWDGDKFEQIQKLMGHHGEIWALAVSRGGDFLVSASHDKGIRVWKQTDEQIFLEEEREKDLEELYEKTLTASLEKDEEDSGSGQANGEVVDAGKQTTQTLMAGERIVEALDTGIDDLELVAAWRAQKLAVPNLAPPHRNLVYAAHGNVSAEEHVLSVVERIQAASLQDALLVLSFQKVEALFRFLGIWIERRWNLPLACRILFFMLRTHYNQIVASKTMRPMLGEIRGRLRLALRSTKDEMGFNLAAVRHLEGMARAGGVRSFVDEEAWAEEDGKGGGSRAKKRAFVNIA